MGLKSRVAKVLRRIEIFNKYYGALQKYYEEEGKYKGYLPLLKRGLLDRKTDSNDEELLLKIADLYSDIKKIQKNYPEAYQVGGEWAVHIAEREHLYECLLKKDVPKMRELFGNFWRNGLQAIVANYDYFSNLNHKNNQEKFLKQFWTDYETWKRISDNGIKDLSTPNIGNIWGVDIENNVIVPQAFRYDRNASVIQELLDGTENPVVAEIGPGYGGMSYYMMKRMKNLKFINIDIPETLAIYAYFMSKALPDKKVFWFHEPVKIDGKLLKEYDILLLPNFMIQNIDNNSVDLFHNAISMSEMSFLTVSEYVKQIQRIVKKYFYHVNIDREGVVNKGHTRILGSKYPIDKSVLKKIIRIYDPYLGPKGLYSEFIYFKP